MPNLVDDVMRREVMESHNRVNGYAKSQKHSYDNFMAKLLPHIIEEFSNPAVVHDSESTRRRHVISLKNVRFERPCHRESDGRVSQVLPEDARLRLMDYTVSVMVDVVHDVFALDEKSTPIVPISVGGEDVIPPEWTMHLPAAESRTVFREVQFFEIPMMLQSEYCGLNGMSRVPDTTWNGTGLRTPSAECPRDEGGYFIIRGLDRTLQMQETLRTNTAFVFPVKQPNKYGLMCEVRSRAESKLRSTSTLRMNITTRRGGTPPSIVVVLPFLSTDIPLGVLFRLIGVTDTTDMKRAIVGPTSLPPDVLAHVEPVLNHTMMDLEEKDIVEHIGRAGSKENTTEARVRYVKHLLENEFLPHIGLTNSRTELKKKAMYLGMMARRLLVAYTNTPRGFKGGDIESLGVLGMDDRDDYANKRLSTAGIMTAMLLRQHVRRFTKSLKRSLVTLVENRRPLDVGNLVKTHKITSDLRYAFRTGNWSVQHTQSNQNVGITQIVNRMSHLSLKSQIGRINTPMNRDGKLTHPRQAHMSTWGLVCPNETPEGVGCGLVKNLAVLTHIRVGTPGDMVTDALVMFADVTPMESGGEQDEHAPWVMVNGDIVGTHPDPCALVTTARQLRRKRVLPYDATVVRCGSGVAIYTDAGCCLRPLFIVDALPRLREAREYVQNTPGIELWTHLLDSAIIEYLDKSEEYDMRVAVTGEELEQATHDDPEPYTHLEISPVAILGHCARAIPFADRNQAPRNIYQASMGKQAVAVPTLPYMHRFDAQMHVPYYTQRPLVGTGTEDPEFNMGINAVVAIMQYTGFNQEDSVIMNKAFVERGGFRSTYYTTHTAEEKGTGADPECFENPAECTEEVVGLKQANYDALDASGTIELNTLLTPGTVLIGKTMATPNVDGKGNRTTKRDNSVVYNGMDTGARVDRILLTNNRDGVNCQRVRTRSTRIPIVGDKFSSRHGQKGTVGVLLPQEDMPFSVQTGISPDIIINPCALPSRMTIAHLVECVASKTGVVLGKFVDGEPFRKMSVEHDLCDALHAAGYERTGNERMICGTTGEMLEASVFVGPTYYQRLKHMTADKIHSRSTGPRTTVTRQPTEGRSNMGGLRLGEMEHAGIVSHGVSAVLTERYLYASDAYRAPMCTDCGVVAEHAYQPEMGETVRGRVARCRQCGETNVSDVCVPYAYKLLTQELGAMGISVSHVFSKK